MPSAAPASIRDVKLFDEFATFSVYFEPLLTIFFFFGNRSLSNIVNYDKISFVLVNQCSIPLKEFIVNEIYLKPLPL